MQSPRIGLVFWLWQCDKENHGWREGPPPFDAGTIPNKRVERWDERVNIGRSPNRLPRIHVGLFFPPLDAHGKQALLLDKFGYQAFGDGPRAAACVFGICPPRTCRQSVAPIVNIEVARNIA